MKWSDGHTESVSFGVQKLPEFMLFLEHKSAVQAAEVWEGDRRLGVLKRSDKGYWNFSP